VRDAVDSKVLMGNPLNVTDALTDAQYHAKTAAVLASVEARIDAWLQDDVIDIDAQRTGGLLELTFPNRSKIVLNTQPPLHELWMAARAGGYHYRYVDGVWRDREGREFFEALSACASEQSGRTLGFEAPR
jgi:CyaY protein